MRAPRVVKFVHSGEKKYPSTSSGTPRTTLPSAAPRKTVSSRLAPVNTTSQNGRHTTFSRWLRNSSAMARRMSSQSTAMSGR